MQTEGGDSQSDFTNDPKAIRRVFINLFISVAIAMIGIGIIAPILPLYIKTLGASGISLGLVFAAFPVARAALGPLAGRLSDRFGRRRLILLGLSGYTVLSILYVTATSLWQLALFRFLQGAASALITPIAQAYVGDLTPKGKEGQYMNIFYTSMFFGMALGPLIGGTLSEAWSIQAAFYTMGGLSFLSLILTARYVPADRACLRGGKENQLKTIPPLRRVLRSDAIKAISIYMASRGFWRQGFNAFYPVFAVMGTGLGEAKIGIILSTYMLAEGLLQVPFGYLADRFPHLPQIGIGGFLAPVTLLFIPAAQRIGWVFLLIFVMGGMSALARASVLAIRTEVGRDYGMGTVVGLQGGAFSIGRFLGPLGCGIIADLFGIGAIFPFAGTIGLIGTSLGLLWFRRWEAGEDHPWLSRGKRFER